MRTLVLGLAAVAVLAALGGRADAGGWRSRPPAGYGAVFPGKPVRHGSPVVQPLSTPTRVFANTFTGGPGAAATVHSLPRNPHPWSFRR